MRGFLDTLYKHGGSTGFTLQASGFRLQASSLYKTNNYHKVKKFTMEYLLLLLLSFYFIDSCIVMTAPAG